MPFYYNYDLWDNKSMIVTFRPILYIYYFILLPRVTVMKSLIIFILLCRMYDFMIEHWMLIFYVVVPICRQIEYRGLALIYIYQRYPAVFNLYWCSFVRNIKCVSSLYSQCVSPGNETYMEHPYYQIIQIASATLKIMPKSLSKSSFLLANLVYWRIDMIQQNWLCKIKRFN